MASVDHLLRQAEESLRLGQPRQAESLLGRILDQDPDNCQAMLQRAQLLARTGNPAGALALLHRIVEIDPNHAEACFGLWALYQDQGDLQRSITWLQRALTLRPDDPIAAYNLALGLQELGREDEAIDLYRLAVRLDPGFVQASNNLGNTLLRAGKLDEAKTCYLRALESDPTLVEANYNLGLVLKKQKLADAATDYLQRTLRLKPDHAQALFTLGAIQQESGEYNAAIPWYVKAIQADPAYVEAHSNLGIAYQHLGNIQAAMDQIVSAIKLCTGEDRRGPIDKGQDIEDSEGGGRKTRNTSFSDIALDALYYNLGYLLRKQGRMPEWFENFEAFTRNNNGSLHYLLYGRDATFLAGDFDKTETFIERLIEHDYKASEWEDLAKVLSEIQYAHTEPANILALYRRFNDLAKEETQGRTFSPDPEPIKNRKIRIGYLSPDFKTHVMGMMMIDVMTHHDRDRFQIHCYALGGKEDEITRKFIELSDKFVRLGDMSAFDAARLIAADKLDLLVDLAGLTDGSKPLLLAYKPARVQLTHLGYHGSIGIDTVDFKITDQYADLPGNEQFMVEKLLPMAGCVMPLHHEEAAREGQTRHELGIPEDAVVFGEFVNVLKLSQDCLETWREILARIDKAVLAFSPFHTHEHDAFLRRARAAGIPEQRITFIPHSPGKAASRARYRLLDIVLDTFPYSGGDTTMAALDMAVPVVTLCGTRQSERMTYSILKHLGLDECIAHSREEYVDIACRLAQDFSRRRDLAASIPRLLRDSGMADMARYTANLEQAYLQALRSKGLL